MNLPNKLTLMRVFLVPIFVFFIMADYIPHNYLIALIVFSLASYTDFLDGSIARKNGLVTNFGKFADPLADKIMVMSALLCFLALGKVNVWLVILIMFREFAVTSVRLVAAGNGKVIAANMLGKIKTVSQIIAIIVILLLSYVQSLLFNDNPVFSADFTGLFSTFYIIGECFMAVATFFALLSGYEYVKQNWDSIKQMK